MLILAAGRSNDKHYLTVAPADRQRAVVLRGALTERAMQVPAHPPALAAKRKYIFHHDRHTFSYLPVVHARGW